MFARHACGRRLDTHSSVQEQRHKGVIFEVHSVWYAVRRENGGDETGGTMRIDGERLKHDRILLALCSKATRSPFWSPLGHDAIPLVLARRFWVHSFLIFRRSVS